MSASVQAQSDDAKLTEGRFRSHIAKLASDSLHGRPSGTVYERQAAAYISGQLSSMGLPVRPDTFDVHVSGSTIICHNIIAYIDEGADSTIVICAHYDGLGTGSGKSLEIRRHGVHPGADDNASGVALMIELGRYLQGQTGRRYNFLLIALTAHEIGLYGSAHITSELPAHRFRIREVINLDMVGRLDSVSKGLRVSGAQTDTSMQHMLSEANIGGLYLRYDDAVHNDYGNFSSKGYKTLSFTTGIHDDYHRISDTPGRINYSGMVSILKYLERVIEQIR